MDSSHLNEQLDKLFSIQGNRKITNYSIDNEIYDFLSEQISLFNPDFIVLVERKATAIVRALKEKYQSQFNFPWHKIISSSALYQISDGLFVNKKVILFDDMMKTGEHLNQVIEILQNKFALTSSQLKICVFAIHENSSNSYLWGDSYKVSSYYNFLAESTYRIVRNRILNLLEKSGSLLLDTEHIEIRVKVEPNNFNHFIESFNNCGKTVVIYPSQDRKNITVFYDDDGSEINPNEADDRPQIDFNKAFGFILFQNDVYSTNSFPFPTESKFEGIVKKSRIVQRKFNEYAIIPICYPDVSSEVGEWLNNPFIKELFGNYLSAENESIFYSNGLLAALVVLYHSLRDLAESGIEEKSIILPQVNDHDYLDDNGYTLNHIKVMYPNLNLPQLIEIIAKIQKEAWHKGVENRNKSKRFKVNRFTQPVPTNEELCNQAALLLQVMGKEIDRSNIKKLEKGEQVRHPSGLKADEIFKIASNCQMNNRPVISSLFDILIDTAYVVTHVEKRRLENQTIKYVRTFEPDGEIVSDMVRNRTAVNGLPSFYKSF